MIKIDAAEYIPHIIITSLSKPGAYITHNITGTQTVHFISIVYSLVAQQEVT